MELEQHKEEFQEIVKKYRLFTTQKAKEIGLFLTNQLGMQVSALEFAKKYEMTEQEAKIFLSFIQKGIEFKESHIDSKK